MPVDEIIDINAELTLEKLNTLDRMADKAAKSFDKAERLQKKKTGIFAGERVGRALPLGGRGPLAEQQDPVRIFSNFNPYVNKDQSSQFDNYLAKRMKKVIKDDPSILGSLGKINKIADKADDAFALLSNPIGFIAQFLKSNPYAAAAIIVPYMMAEIMKWMTQRGRPFDRTLVDRIDDRINALRSKDQQARIAAGQDQLILTTRSGTTTPRDAYNTFNEYEKNQRQLAKTFAIRNTVGLNG